jgi:hypothetical protein
MRRLAAAVAAFLLSSVAVASDLNTDLKRCAAINDGLQRLTCYDALAGRDGASAPAPVPTRSASARAKEAPSRQCQATTKKGRQCSRTARPGSSYCWQHGG